MALNFDVQQYLIRFYSGPCLSWMVRIIQLEAVVQLVALLCLRKCQATTKLGLIARFRPQSEYSVSRAINSESASLRIMKPEGVGLQKHRVSN